MAVWRIRSFIPLLSITCFTITVTVSNGMATGNKVLVERLWDITSNDTQPCIIDHGKGAEGILFFHGNSYHTCSLNVTVSSGSLLFLEVPNSDHAMTDKIFFLYIKREGKVIACPSRYLVLNRESEKCSVIFKHTSLKITLQGNVSLLISGMSALESTFTCPEVNGDNELGQKVRERFRCYNVIGYNNKITCASLEDGSTGECRLNFTSNCNATLNYREVGFRCLDDDQEINSQMVIYPINVTTMDLAENGIVKLGVGSFADLYDLKVLKIQMNKLEMLQEGVFYGLDNLKELWLRENHLIKLDAAAFHDLHNLKYLSLSDNYLNTLHVGLFERLIDLTHLDLSGNLLNTLPAVLFQNLRNLNELLLSENQLIKLEIDLFQGLGNLNHLYLHENNLHALPVGLFRDQESLTVLSLHNNALVKLYESLFQPLVNLADLDLSHNMFETLPAKLFQNLISLERLIISNNQLVILDVDLFKGLHNLDWLFFSNNKLNSMPIGLFRDLEKLSLLLVHRNQLFTLDLGLFYGLDNIFSLYLSENPFASLPSGVFQGLESLQSLFLSSTRLTTLQTGLFDGLANVFQLSIKNNDKLVTLDVDVFRGMHGLYMLEIERNVQLTTLDPDIFQGLSNLNEIYLRGNQLTMLNVRIFRNLNRLDWLDLDHNKLNILPDSLFSDLRNLNLLYMRSNQLSSLPSNIFNGTINLKYLFLQDNLLKELHENIFQENVYLYYIDISGNRLENVPNFINLTNLNFLNLGDNSLTWVNGKSFIGIGNETELLVNQHEICKCYVSYETNCNAADDISPYLTCDRLLSDRALVVIMWLICLNALGGNIFVLIWKKKYSKNNKVQGLLVSNLAASDALMGVYMLIIVSADVYFGEHFPMRSETWRSSIICRTAGSLSIASSEASVFFVTLISIDRFLNICFPFSTKQIGTKSAKVTAALIWIFTLALGIVPSTLAGRNFKFYDNSHVCIGLPLALTKQYTNEVHYTYPRFSFVGDNDVLNTRPYYRSQYQGLRRGLFFSTAVFLGLNCVCYLIILACYTGIIRAVKRSSERSGRTRDMQEQIKLTRKVTAIVATDFFCWFPIILLGILVQSRALTLPPSVYAWSVTIVLPINSAINPYLYTIAEMLSNYRKEKGKKKTTETTNTHDLG